jgi:pimeloyl-ACP methyl ester carboxylesterase
MKSVRVSVHVIAFEEDIEAPPQDGEEAARLIPGAELHLMPGMGHGSWYGHAQDILNPYIEELIRRHL